MNPLCRRTPRKHAIARGFTLVELLIVIAIISLLAGLLLPALEQALWSARFAACSNQQKQLALNATLYGNDNSDRLPPTVSWYTNYDPSIGSRAHPSYGAYHAEEDVTPSRAIAHYLGPYVPSAEFFYCPFSANYDDAWNDAYMNPPTGFICGFGFLWNYANRGACSLTDDPGKLLSIDYGYTYGPSNALDMYFNHPFDGAIRESVKPYYKAVMNFTASYGSYTVAYNAGEGGPPGSRVNASFLDGHVTSYPSISLIRDDAGYGWGFVPPKD